MGVHCLGMFQKWDAMFIKAKNILKAKIVNK